MGGGVRVDMTAIKESMLLFKASLISRPGKASASLPEALWCADLKPSLASDLSLK